MTVGIHIGIVIPIPLARVAIGQSKQTVAMQFAVLPLAVECVAIGQSKHTAAVRFSSVWVNLARIRTRSCQAFQ
jgi:hypothetical protein